MSIPVSRVNADGASLTLHSVRKRPRLWWVVGPLYVSTFTLIYHQRVGLYDDAGANWVQIALRSETWFALSVALGSIFIPKWTWWPPARFGAGTVLFVWPLLALLSALVSSALAGLHYGVVVDALGIQVPVRMLICIGLGVLVFNLALVHEHFSGNIVALLTWTPLLSLMFGVLAVIAPGLLEVLFGADVLAEGAGLFGVGTRFQGLSSNPNMLATSSGIALAFLVPRVLQRRALRLRVLLLTIMYMLGLVGIMVLSGVRAMLVLLVAVFFIALWVRFRFTMRGLVGASFNATKIGLVIGLGVLVFWQTDVTRVLIERLSTDDGRFFLWSYYAGLLFEHPLGLGFGYETIVDTAGIISGQRLPPHNTLLEMAMYGGLAGLAVHLAVLGAILFKIVRLRRTRRPQMLSLSEQGLVLAWSAVVISKMFGGLIFIDFHFVILTALLLAATARFVTRPRQHSMPVEA